jgi:hypothetical protein
MKYDEYGDIPGQGGAQYATADTILPDADLHVKGTMPRSGGRLEFWLSQPRPKGISIKEWDKITQAKWDQAFSRS